MEEAATFKPIIEESLGTRAVRHGIGDLSALELLGLVLGNRGARAKARAGDLVTRAGSLNEIARMPVEEFIACGFSWKAGARLAAAFELGRRSLVPRPERAQLEAPEDAAKLLMPLLQHGEVEVFGVLVLDARNALIARRTISIGSVNQSIVHPRDLFRPLVRLGACRAILYHLHPSGQPEPSPEDVALTRRLVEVGRLIGIEILDHIIIGDGCWESLRERGSAGFDK